MPLRQPKYKDELRAGKRVGKGFLGTPRVSKQAAHCSHHYSPSCALVAAKSHGGASMPAESGDVDNGTSSPFNAG